MTLLICVSSEVKGGATPSDIEWVYRLYSRQGEGFNVSGKPPSPIDGEWGYVPRHNDERAL
jgi:hypothetical protein